MTLTTFIAYFTAAFLAAVTPGPSMLAVIATSLSRGTRAGFLVGCGVAAGDLVLVNIALLGLIALAQTFAMVFFVVKYAGAAYLVWLGYRMWRAAVPQAAAQGEAAKGGGSRAFLLGAAIAFGNPKAILFHASLMPLILDLHALTIFDALAVMAVVITVNLVTMGGYSLLAGLSCGWFRSGSRMRWMNRVAGGAMIGTGALIASR